jgi:hypothetical protein
MLISAKPRCTAVARNLLFLAAIALSATAQTPIVPLETLIATGGTVTAGDVTFSNFQKPNALPRPLGAALFEFNDIGVSATANGDGTVTLNLVFIDPATGLATPNFSTGDVTRLVTYTATSNNPVLRLNLVTQAFGAGTHVNGSVTQIYNLLYHVDPARVAYFGSGPVYTAIQDWPTGAPYPSMLPGGNPPSTTLTNEFGILKGHLGIPSAATMDSINMTFTLLPVGAPVPPVVVNSFAFLVDPLSGIVQFQLNAFAQDGGAVIALTSDNPGVLPVPPSFTVPQGTFVSAPLALGPANIDFPTVVNITGTMNGFTTTTAYTANPPLPLAITSFSVGTIGCFNGPCAVNTTARLGFLLNRTNVSAETVTLTSSNPAICPVPASITIPAFTSPSGVPVISMTCTPVAVNTPITYTATMNGVVYTTVGTLPRTIDSVLINKAELVVKNLSLKVEASNTVPNDVLTLYNNANGLVIGTMTYVGLSGGGGKYSFQGTLAAPVTTLLLKSALNGSTTFAVSLK